MQGGRSKRRLQVLIVTLFFLEGSIFLVYLSVSSNLHITPPIAPIGPVKESYPEVLQLGNDPWDGEKKGVINNDIDKQIAHKYDFNISGRDVMVFLHIQKTGGTTFGEHLVQDLDLEVPCQCTKDRRRCPCLRPGRVAESWQFSRLSTGWPCGVHADWTELQSCVPWYMDKKERKMVRRYFYITMLRDPVERYISEWRYVQGGATWVNARYMCNDSKPLPGQVVSCYEGRKNWIGVTLEEFITCPHNLANNRQVRMLADLNLVGCYNLSKHSPEERNSILLESAKSNLRRFAYFGLTEYQKESQYIFEETFNMKFKKPFEQDNDTVANSEPLEDEIRDRVIELNRYDIELYKFARELFFERLTYMKEHEGEGELS